MDVYDLLYEIRTLRAEKQREITRLEADRGYEEPHVRDPYVAHCYGQVAALSTVLDTYTMHEDKIAQQARQVASDMAAAGVRSEHVDEFIHDLRAGEAASINNSDLEGQVAYLLDTGWLESEVRKELLRCKEEYEEERDDDE